MIEDDYRECEHLEGSMMGKCAICGRMVCGDCYRNLFNQLICNAHPSLEDESSWELIGFYSDQASLAERKFLLDEQGITSIPVEGEGDAIELYVPIEEREDAWEALRSAGEESLFCMDCKVQYSPDVGVCPVCGVRPVES